IKHERITSFETPVSKAAFQLKQVTKELSVRPLAVYDRGYGNAIFVKATANIEGECKLKCVKSGIYRER
ncbi:MAG: transposase, partial [Pseudanabaena sp.]